MDSKKYFFFILLFFVSSVCAQPSFNINESDYTIHGTTADQLRAQMNTLGPGDPNNKFDANTKWYVTWHYNFGYEHGDCILTRIRVKVDINTVLPSWADYSSADPALKTKWDKYIGLLKAHQQHHIDNGKDAATDIYNLLNAAPPMPSCMDLGTSVNNQALQVLKTYEDRGYNYDTTTNYGQTEGVVFP